MTSKPPIQNRFTETEYNDYSTYSSQSAFTSAVDVTMGRESEWATVIDITKSFNTSTCSLIPITKTPLEDTDRCIGGVYTVKSVH